MDLLLFSTIKSIGSRLPLIRTRSMQEIFVQEVMAERPVFAIWANIAFFIKDAESPPKNWRTECTKCTFVKEGEGVHGGV